MKRVLFLHSLLLCIVLSQSLPAQAQNARFQWIHRIGDSGDDHLGLITNDDSGNLFVTGVFIGTIILGSDTLNSYSPFDRSAFIAKYNSEGIPQWASVLPLNGGSFIEMAFNRIRISQSGKIGIVGAVDGNAYYALLHPDGSPITFNDQDLNQALTDIDFDSLDNNYVAGYFLNSQGSAYIVKYDSTGNYIWSYYLPTPSRTCNLMLSEDTVYVTGQFHYQLQLGDSFGTAPLNFTASWGLNDWDFFLAKYSPDGHLLGGYTDDGLVPSSAGPFEFFASDFTIGKMWKVLWQDAALNFGIKTYSQGFQTISNSIIANTNCAFGSVAAVGMSRWQDELVTSYWGLLCNESPGYHISGNGLVDKTFDIPQAGPANYAGPRSVSVDPSGGIYIGNSFKGNFQYQDSLGVTTMTSSTGSEDMYIGKVYICPDFNAQIQVYGDDSMVCTAAGLSYQWYFSNTAIPGATTLQYIATQTGSYSLVISNDWGCSDTLNRFVNIPNSVLPIATPGETKVFPNPTNNVLWISGLPNNSVIQITTVEGVCILTDVYSGQGSIDISKLANGVYFLTTSNGVFKICKY